MIQTKCIICGDSAYKALYEQNFSESQIDSKIFSARRVPDHYHYRIVRCVKCGLIYSNPILEPGKIQALYADSYQTYDIEVANIKSTYGYYLNKLSSFLRQKERMLEIGCGSGFFLEVAKKFGFNEVYGVEPSKDAVKKADKSIRGNILNKHFEVNDFKKNSFDLICVFQTIEHLISPGEFLMDCFSLLKPKGIIFVIAHNTDSLLAKLMKENSPIIDIEHIYLFNKKTLWNLFSKFGYIPIKVFDISNKYSLNYWFRMLSLSGWINKYIFSMLNTTGLGVTNLSVNAGNIGIYAQKN